MVLTAPAVVPKKKLGEEYYNMINHAVLELTVLKYLFILLFLLIPSH